VEHLTAAIVNLEESNTVFHETALAIEEEVKRRKNLRGTIRETKGCRYSLLGKMREGENPRRRRKFTVSDEVAGLRHGC